MESSYTIIAHPTLCLLEINMRGLFDPAHARQFAAEKEIAFQRLRCKPNEHVTLVDVTACLIQPQSVVGMFQSIIADPRFKARRIAFVVGGSLAKMQLRRILDGRDTQYFQSRDAAERWLFEP